MYKDFPDTPKGRRERFEFYTSDDGINLIEGWRRQGIKIGDILSDYIGISAESFRKWKIKEPRLLKAMNVGLDICNSKVEKSLYKRARGYYYWEKTFELIEGEMRLTKKVKKHVIPDTKAILSWLYNHMPNQYRAVQEPLEDTEYQDTIKEILVAMKEVADTGEEKQIDIKESIE